MARAVLHLTLLALLASANTIAARESEAGVSIRPVNAQAPSAIAIESTPSTVAMLRKEQQLQRSTLTCTCRRGC
jgi:hypothetical protein